MPIWQWQGHYLMIKRGKTLSRNFLSKHINLMHESARHKKLTCLTYSKEHKVKISSLQWHLLNQRYPAESNLQNIEVSTNYFTHSLSWNRRTEYKKKKVTDRTSTFPPIRKSSARSWNCPWISPQIVTGLFTGCG